MKNIGFYSICCRHHIASLGHNELRYSIPNALVYHSKYAFQLLREKKSKVLISFSKHHKIITWYPNYIFLTSINFSDHTCCRGNHTKYNFYKDFWRKQNFCRNSKTIADVIIFCTVWDIHLGIISVNFGAILTQKIWVIEIFLLLWIFIISEIINTKSTKNQQQIYIQFIYL